MKGKLIYKLGDLLQAAVHGEVQVIAQCNNCFNTRRSGIAPQIDKHFPEAGAVDDSTKKGDKEKLGGYSSVVCDTPSGSVWVYNLYGQFGFWGRRDGIRDLDYDEMHNSLSHMTEDVSCGIMERAFSTDDESPPPRIGIPALGCGLAGGDWSIVSVMIEESLCQVADVIVYVHRLDEFEKYVQKNRASNAEISPETLARVASGEINLKTPLGGWKLEAA